MRDGSTRSRPSSSRTGFQRAGAQHLVERRARRRRRRVATLALGVPIIVGVATASTWLAHDSAEDLTEDLTAVAGASTSREADDTTTTAITTPPNELLAPAPTVVPDHDDSDGLAPLIRRVDTTDPVIFITIDDGQVRDPSYLERFETLGVPFTSFLTQPLAKADPEYWRATMARGGSIQTHTINHPDLRRSSESVVRREVCEPADTFAEMFGVRPTLFRPPFGNSSDTVRRVAAQCGYRAVVHWSGSTNIGILSMQEGELKPGDIILMHYRDTLQADLDDVVARAKEQGLRIGRLEDYLAPGE